MSQYVRSLLKGPRLKNPKLERTTLYTILMSFTMTISVVTHGLLTKGRPWKYGVVTVCCKGVWHLKSFS